MKTVLKKLLTVMVVVGLFSSYSTGSFSALAVDSNITLEEACKSYVLTFIRHVTDDETFNVAESTEVYDGTGELTGYDVALTKNNISSGHAFINFKNPHNLVSEYSLEGGDIVTILEGTINETMDSTIESAETSVQITKLYQTMPMRYSAELSSNQNAQLSYFDTVEGIVNESQFSSIIAGSYVSAAQSNTRTEVDWIHDIILSEEEIPSSYAILEDHNCTDARIVGYVGSGEPYSSYFSENSGRNYGCTPTAVTNILYYMENKRNCTGILQNGNWFYTYDVIYDRLNTFDGSGGTLFPASTVAQVVPAYARERGFTSQYIAANALDMSEIIDNIDLNRPILFNYFDSVWSGHSIFVLGYRVYIDTRTHDDVYRYLVCANGWNPYVTYFSFDDIPSHMMWTAGALTLYK